MTNIELRVSGAFARAYVCGPLTAGAVGIPVRCIFDSDWDGLTPHLVAVAPGEARDMAISADGLSAVPWEALKENSRLLLAIDGKNADGSIRIPTIWADCGTVRPSPGSVKREESTPPPTPTEIEQLMALVRRAENKMHAPKIDDETGNWLVWDDFTGDFIDSGVPASGEVDEATIASLINAYFSQNPIQWSEIYGRPFTSVGAGLMVVDGRLVSTGIQQETDPTVPKWAKEPNKPSYTAAEVHALPDDTPIPPEVTEATVAGWGFTKNKGTYSKPDDGIPKADLSSDVQDGLTAAVPKTAAMTQPVGKDKNGQLFTEPGGGEIALESEAIPAPPTEPFMVPTDKTFTKDNVPADAAETGKRISQLKDDFEYKLSEPANMEVGKYFRIAAIDENGHAVLEAVDAPGGGVTDVQVNNVSAVKDGVANVPIGGSTSKNAGVVYARRDNDGVKVAGYLAIIVAPENIISARTNGDKRPIVPETLDYAVKAAMCDGKGVAWDSASQLAALARLGITVGDNGICHFG